MIRGSMAVFLYCYFVGVLLPKHTFWQSSILNGDLGMLCLFSHDKKMSDSIAYHLCWDLDVECHFQQYVSYSMAVNSLGWGNQQPIEKSLTNFAAFKGVTCTLLHGRKSDGSGNRHCNIMDQICLDQICALHSLCK
jgi:hypothetical protein